MKMDWDNNNKTVRFTYTVTAVVFGADETILKVNLCDGFRFVRKSLIPLVDNMDTVFDTTVMGLRRDYETAIINRKRLEVICIEKKQHFVLNTSNAHLFFCELTQKDLLSIDNQIRTIRLLNEGNLNFKKISYTMLSEQEVIDNIKGSSQYNSIIPITEAFGSKTIKDMHLDEDSISVTNSKLSESIIPFVDPNLSICHAYYDLSYHNDNYISIVLLITSLEMIFIENEEAKKEKLSKRSAIYLKNTEEKIASHYERMKCIYKKRSVFVHDGEFESITDDDILFLRQCVRDTLLKLVNDSRTKKERIRDLKNMAQRIWNNSK